MPIIELVYSFVEPVLRERTGNGITSIDWFIKALILFVYN